MQIFETILVIYESGSNETTIIDIFGNRIEVSVSIRSILESLCKSNGLSLDAALLNSKKTMRAKKNPPINLCYKSKIAYFRVMSGRKGKGSQIWIKYSPLVKCKADQNGKYHLTYQGRFLMGVEFNPRRFKLQYDKIYEYYHNEKNCQVQELLIKSLLNRNYESV